MMRELGFEMKNGGCDKKVNSGGVKYRAVVLGARREERKGEVIQ